MQAWTDLAVATSTTYWVSPLQSCLGRRNAVRIVGGALVYAIVGEDTHIRMHALTYTYIRTSTLQPALTPRIKSYPHTHILSDLDVYGITDDGDTLYSMFFKLTR